MAGWYCWICGRTFQGKPYPQHHYDLCSWDHPLTRKREWWRRLLCRLGEHSPPPAGGPMVCALCGYDNFTVAEMQQHAQRVQGFAERRLRYFMRRKNR